MASFHTALEVGRNEKLFLEGFLRVCLLFFGVMLWRLVAYRHMVLLQQHSTRVTSTRPRILIGKSRWAYRKDGHISREFGSSFSVNSKNPIYHLSWATLIVQLAKLLIYLWLVQIEGKIWHFDSCFWNVWTNSVDKQSSWLNMDLLPEAKCFWMFVTLRWVIFNSQNSAAWGILGVEQFLQSARLRNNCSGNSHWHVQIII